jgi:hypothetical protein
MTAPLQREALASVLAGCRDQCARAGPAARLLDLLPAALRTDEVADESPALAFEWGEAMAGTAPSEDDLLWLGGVWLATAHRIFGADSETAEALGRWFAVAAECALSEPAGRLARPRAPEFSRGR